jgi:WD40 repeat protein
VGHTGDVSWVAFSPDGKYALTSSDDHTARLWDTLTCKEIRVFEPHFDSVYGAAFSPDGKYVATGSLECLEVDRVHRGATVGCTNRPGSTRLCWAPGFYLECSFLT